MSDPLPLSIVEHFAYCPRQAALIHVEGVWAANADTARGEADHAAIDRGVRSETRSGVTTWFSLPVWSARWGLSGVCDAVELQRGIPTPVEHKPRHVASALASAAAQQLAAQALCLEEMWECEVPNGVLFTRADRRRHVVPIDHGLRTDTTETILACHDLIENRRLPPALTDKRCVRCSLAEICGVTLPEPSHASLFATPAEEEW